MATLSRDLVQEVLAVADSYTAEMKARVARLRLRKITPGSSEAERLVLIAILDRLTIVVQELTLVHDALAEPESSSMQQAAWELRFQTGGLITRTQERLDALRAEAQARIGR